MSKNIIIFGGGEPDTNKFGGGFIRKAREEGHRVINVSHRDHGSSNPDDTHINYFDLQNTKNILNQIKESMPIVDILYFNQNGEAYPHVPEDLFSEPIISKYQNLIHTALIIPQLVVSQLYPENLIEGSKVLFASSMMAFQYERKHYSSAVGYPGAKGFMTHYMSSLARHRTKNVTFSAICPAFLYKYPKLYESSFDITYDYILNHDDSSNGKIFTQLNGLEYPYVEGHVKYEK